MINLKNSLVAFGVLALSALTSISANASILIEPHLGYNLGSSVTYSGDMSGSVLTDAVFKNSGPEYGARAGLQYLGFMGGVAFTHSTYDWKITNIPVVGSTQWSMKRDEVGVFAGYNAPLFFRAWLGYYFSTKATITADYPTNGVTSGMWLSGHTTEIGLGFKFIPLLSLNVLYRMVSFNKSTLNATGEAPISPAISPKEIVVGVSLPFTLL
jgi:hypothetical protein